jgi:hypothetical protein
MKPGTYTATIFQGELEAGTGSVTVKAGATTSLTLTSSLNRPSTIWSIGKSYLEPCYCGRALISASQVLSMEPLLGKPKGMFSGDKPHMSSLDSSMLTRSRLCIRKLQSELFPMPD